MAVTVRLPATLGQLADGQRKVQVDPGTVAGAVETLCTRYPSIGERVLDEGGAIRRFVNIYVNGEDMRLLQEQATPVRDGDEIIIAPAVAGGI